MRTPKDYYKRYNKYPEANPFSMNQRKKMAKELKIKVEEFIRLQTLSVESKRNLWDVLVENKILTEAGELIENN